MFHCSIYRKQFLDNEVESEFGKTEFDRNFMEQVVAKTSSVIGKTEMVWLDAMEKSHDQLMDKCAPDEWTAYLKRFCEHLGVSRIGLIQGWSQHIMFDRLNDKYIADVSIAPIGAPLLLILCYEKKAELCQIYFKKIAKQDKYRLSQFAPLADLASVAKLQYLSYKQHHTLFLDLAALADSEAYTSHGNAAAVFDYRLCKDCPFYGRCKERIGVTSLKFKNDLDEFF